jgi:hypothetical protein
MEGVHVPSLDPTNQLAALIRVQVAALRRQQRGKKAPASERPSSSGTASEPPDLAALVAQRVRSIGADDPQRERKALRVFLETVLLSELGSDLVNDPGFATMVDHVQEQMSSDPDLAAAARLAAQTLLKSADA